MNYLDNALNFMKNKKYKPEQGTFAPLYEYWKAYLFERTTRIFVWNGVEESGVDPKYIEINLMLNGTTGITKYKDKLEVFLGNYSGKPTLYFDTYTDYAIYSPLYSAILKCDSDIIVMHNNSTNLPVMGLVHRYAMMLAHIDVTLINTLINGRDSGGVPIAGNEAQRQSIINYRSSLANGKVTAINDPAFLNVEFKGINKNTTISIKDLQEVQANILDSFYTDLGVKTTWNKKGNMIREEVNGNDKMLLFNVTDMLERRKKDAEKVNALFKTNWSVKLSPELESVGEANVNVNDNQTIV